jgi:hypothetical protein
MVNGRLQTGGNNDGMDFQPFKINGIKEIKMII